LTTGTPKLCLIVCFLTVAILACSQETQRRKDAQNYLDDAQTALAAGKCWNAQNLFRNLLSDFPGSHMVDDAQYGLGQSYFCSGDFETAIFEFERLINEYPVSKFVDESRFQIGMCYFKQSRSIHHDQDETTRAIAEFTRFVEDFPNSEIAPEARKRIIDLEELLAEKDLMIARNYLKWKSPASAEIFCRRLLEKYPDTRLAPQVRFVLAVALHGLGELTEALEILHQLEGLENANVRQSDIKDEVEAVKKAILIENAGDEGVTGQERDLSPEPGA
jgi:outer membrane protein assembly factor BamD